MTPEQLDRLKVLHAVCRFAFGFADEDADVLAAAIADADLIRQLSERVAICSELLAKRAEGK